MGKQILRIHLPSTVVFLMVRVVSGTSRNSPWGLIMYGMMRKLRQRVLAGADECSGAAAVEYAVVLALIVAVCIGALQALGMWNAPVFAMLNDRLKV